MPTFPSGGSFLLTGFGSRNPLLPSWVRILSPPSLREEIFFFLTTTCSSLLGIAFFFFLGLYLRGMSDLEAGKFPDRIAFVDFPLQHVYSKHTSRDTSIPRVPLTTCQLTEFL